MPKCDPRTSLLVGVSIALNGFLGARTAAAGFVLLGIWLIIASMPLRLVLRHGIPLILGSAVLLIAFPFAPAQAARIALRGLLISWTAVMVASIVPWTTPVALLQQLHAPPIVIAFAAILARQLVSFRSDVSRTWRVLLLRGGFGSLSGSLRSLRVLLVALVPSALARSDSLAQALELRGFSGRIPVPSPWRPAARETFHYALVVLALAASFWEVQPWLRLLFA